MASCPSSKLKTTEQSMSTGNRKTGTWRSVLRSLAALAISWMLVVVPGVAGASTVDPADSFAQTLVQSSASHLIGRQARVLSLMTIDDRRIDLAKIYGREAVYLEFWATWCVPCLQQMPHLIRTYELAGGRLFVLAVNTGFNETLPAVLAYRQKMGLKMPIVIDDGRFARAFGLRATPQHVVIDRAGRISYIGHLADSQLDKAILAAEASPPATSSGARIGGGGVADSASHGMGERVPNSFLHSIDHKRIRLYDTASGQRTILYFFSPWCESYFRASRPSMAAACHAATKWVAEGGARDQRVVGIASGLWITAREVADYRANNKATAPMVLDAHGTLFREFGIRTVPAFVVLDSSGNIVSVGQGGHAMASISEAGRS